MFSVGGYGSAGRGSISSSNLESRSSDYAQDSSGGDGEHEDTSQPEINLVRIKKSCSYIILLSSQSIISNIKKQLLYLQAHRSFEEMIKTGMSSGCSREEEMLDDVHNS